MSRTDGIVIAVFMGMFGVFMAVLVASLIRHDKARILWSTTGYVLVGGLCSWLLVLSAFTAFIQNRTAFLIIGAIPAGVLVVLAILLARTNVYGAGGKAAVAAAIVMIGTVAGYGASGSIRDAYGIRQAFSPLVATQPSSGQGTLQPQPWFVLYDEDAAEFDVSRAGTYARYTTDPARINTIVLHGKTTAHVGEWVDTHGTKVAEGIRETLHVTVVDVASWSVVEQQDFEAKGEPTRNNDTGVYTQKISITDNAIKGYLNTLLKPSGVS